MRWLIIANGEKLSQLRLSQLATGRSVIACDGGIHDCIQYGIPVTILIGDFDSISPVTLLESSPTLEIIPTLDQNKTDTEKALIHLIEIGCDDILMCQAMGDRMDHSLINLGLLKQYHSPQRKLVVARERENILFAHDETITIQREKSNQVAILGFPEATVTTKGLKYETNDLKLKLGGVSSGCNQLLGNEASIHVLGNALISQEFQVEH